MRNLPAASCRRYRALQEHTLQEAQRINSRFQTDTWRPIILAPAHQDPRHVFEMYRAADFCMVTRLHDGMNPVAKEFVATGDDENGVLILSTFTASASGEAVRMSRDQRRQRQSNGASRRMAIIQGSAQADPLNHRISPY